MHFSPKERDYGLMKGMASWADKDEGSDMDFVKISRLGSTCK